MAIDAKKWQNSFQTYMKSQQGGPMTSVFADFGDSYQKGAGGGGGPQIENPALPPYDPNAGTDPTKQYWTFPQYSQTWAFTPPPPSPYFNPQPFDPKKYGNPFPKKAVKKNV